jgi:hypothetical protein
MSFGTTVAITYPTDGVTTLNRVSYPSEKDRSAKFQLRESDELHELSIRHTEQKNGMKRHNLECKRTVFGATADDLDKVSLAYVVFPHDEDGVAMSVEVVTAMLNFVLSGTVLADMMAEGA